MRRPTRTKRKSKLKHVPLHHKLDPRLSYILSHSIEDVIAFKEEEDSKLRTVEKEVQLGLQEPDNESSKEAGRSKFDELNRKLFAPITHGLHIPKGTKNQGPARIKEPYVSAFILSDASSEDLSKLGVKVRSQVGDIFTSFIPISLIQKLELSPAIRFIELARPLSPTLNQAVPYSQINALQTSMPPIDGTGVIVGVIDSRLDIFHSDFRSATGATRVLFLWDQILTPQGSEAGPPVAPALPGFNPTGGSTYGVEYNQATINTELNNFNPPVTPAYQTVRHGGSDSEHGTHVTGIAAGNGLAQGGTFTGAAPAANIIFVRPFGVEGTALVADNTAVLDAFAYIFARAAQSGQPCVVNLSSSDNQGPHDGTTLGEQLLDNLLLTPGRAITLSAGNSNNTASHAAGTVPPGGNISVDLNYRSIDTNGDGVPDRFPSLSDDIEIWYDGHDRFTTTVTVPTTPPTVIGPVAPGGPSTSVTLPNGVQVQLTSLVNDPRNGDNLISIIITVPAGQNIPVGNWNITLNGTTVVNGSFNAWVDRNNRGFSAWQAPFLQENQLTLGVPSTARRPITVGNHMKTGPPPTISRSSGRGPTRDARIKPEIATVGTDVIAARSRNMNLSDPGAMYVAMSGTSMSAPLVAGACALIFQCRGALTTCANLKQILENTANTMGLSIPGNDFGFGFMQVGTTCINPANVDVWIRDHPTDTGVEPFTGANAWLSPDIEILDTGGNPVPNPTYHPTNRFNNIIRVTVSNRGTQTAQNTEVYLYWADPATNIPFPSAWNTPGIYTDAPGFISQGNKIVIPQIASGSSVQVQFAWAPPAPGSNLRGDNHFCLLVRLENEGDTLMIGTGGWSAITAKNNIALRNVHVQPASRDKDVEMSFYVVGSSDKDSLIVYNEIAHSRVSIKIPLQVLPWRDIKLIERSISSSGRVGKVVHRRAHNEHLDLLEKRRIRLEGEKEIRMKTDIEGAEALDVQNGIATIFLSKKNNKLFIPDVRLSKDARMPASIKVSKPEISKENRFVHVAQLSGGQLVGGVTLELIAQKELKERYNKQYQ